MQIVDKKDLMIRIFDVVFSYFVIFFTFPIVISFLFLVWINDFKSPIYISRRIGMNYKPFKLFKIRSMKYNSDRFGINTTSKNDFRLLTVGKLIRKFKIDELLQFWNVLFGDMEVIGPRPQIQQEVNLYTDIEKDLLSVRPGISDISSIVFYDLDEIVKDYKDTNLAYNQLIRPWKSRFGIFYIKNKNLWINFLIIIITIISTVSHKFALRLVYILLRKLNADPELLKISLRNATLKPLPPPGLNKYLDSLDLYVKYNYGNKNN